MRKVMAVLLAASLAGGCAGNTVTGPDPVETTEAAAPVSAATPAPQPVAGPQGPAFELSGANGVLYVKNLSGNVAVIETWYTSFDNQELAFDVRQNTVQNGDTVERQIGSCRQGDARAVPGKEIGGVFFDKNGASFNPTRNPEKVAECRKIPPPVDACPNLEGDQASVPQGYHLDEGQCVPDCVVEWTLDKDYTRTTEQEYPWSECVHGSQSRVEKIYFETNSCTEERRVNHEFDKIKTRDCHTPGICYYNVSGGPAENEGPLCTGLGGIWLNFVSGALKNHCQFNLPGVYKDVIPPTGSGKDKVTIHFNLAPGQSDDACRKGNAPQD